jgi:hypothetical protein
MAILQIPTLTDGTQSYIQRTELDGDDYLMSFLYNLRRDRWSMSLQSLDGTFVLTGQTIHLQIPLNRRAVGGPPGVLIALPEAGEVDAPGLHDLGDGGSVKLYYVTADDPLLTGSS